MSEPRWVTDLNPNDGCLRHDTCVACEEMITLRPDVPTPMERYLGWLNEHERFCPRRGR